MNGNATTGVVMWPKSVWNVLFSSCSVAPKDTTMENPEVAQVFEEVADLLDIQGANPFRVRAYRAAARTIRDLSEPLAQMAAEPKKLVGLAGIGKDLAEKIATILTTCDLPLRQELRAQVPSGLRELLNLPSLGPKRAQFLYQ